MGSGALSMDRRLPSCRWRSHRPSPRRTKRNRYNNCLPSSSAVEAYMGALCSNPSVRNHPGCSRLLGRVSRWHSVDTFRMDLGPQLGRANPRPTYRNYRDGSSFRRARLAALWALVRACRSGHVRPLLHNMSRSTSAFNGRRLGFARVAAAHAPTRSTDRDIGGFPL